MPKQRLIYKVYTDYGHVVADAEVTYHVEHDYGADTDGRRGICKTIVDNVQVNEIVDENENYMNWQTLPIELKEKVMASAEEHL